MAHTWIGFSVLERIIFAVFLEDKLFVEKLPEGVNNGPLIKTNGLCIPNFELIARRKHCKHLQASLLDTSVKCIATENKNVVEFLPKIQIQEYTKLGPKSIT